MAALSPMSPLPRLRRVSVSSRRRHRLGLGLASFRQRLPRDRGLDFALEFYSFVADNHAPFYSRPIECTDRDAPFVLDGVLYPESDLNLEEHYTDTHGYTEINFAAFGMVGMRFCPRIRSLHRQRILLRRPGPRPRRPRAGPPARPSGGELEHAHAGAGHGHFQEHGAALARPLRRHTPPGADLQALGRPVLHREGARHRRALPQPARPRDGPVREREVADSGAQSHPADSLFAALDIATGQVFGQCRKRQRHEEFLWFLRLIDREVPAELDIHLVLDNYATHKHATVRRWLAARPRFHLHFYAHLGVLVEPEKPDQQIPRPRPSPRHRATPPRRHRR